MKRGRNEAGGIRWDREITTEARPGGIGLSPTHGWETKYQPSCSWRLS